jgi:hypothetical protein
VSIEWPSGTKQNLGAVPANQFLRVDEANGILK